MPCRLPGQPFVGTAAGIVRRFARDLKQASSRRGDGCLLNDGIYCAIPGPSLSLFVTSQCPALKWGIRTCLR